MKYRIKSKKSRRFDDVDRLLMAAAELMREKLTAEFKAAGKKPLPPESSFQTFDELLEYIENRKKEKENGN